MDRFEDQASNDDRYSQLRSDADYGTAAEEIETDDAAAYGETGIEAIDPPSASVEFEYPAHEVTSGEGELLFDSSDRVDNDDVDLPWQAIAPEPQQGTVADERYPFVERRSQPWIDDETSTGVQHGSAVESGEAGSWPTLDIGEPDHDPDSAVDAPSVEVEGYERSDDDSDDDDLELPSSTVVDASEPLDLSADGLADSSGEKEAEVAGSAGYETESGDTEVAESRRSCRICSAPVSQININVDGNALILESCDECDSRRWHLDGQPIDLKRALDEVGEHAGRRQ